MQSLPYSAKQWGETLANPEQFSSFIHPNLYHKTALKLKIHHDK